MLSVRKIHAGRGAVDYYLGRTRNGLASYYLTDANGPDAQARLAVPPSSWWGGSAAALDLIGVVERDDFVPLYGRGVRPDGTRLGRRFRLPEEAQDAKDAALAAASRIEDPEERQRAEFDVRRRSWQASVAAWDCAFSPVKSVSLLWAAGDPGLRRQVWAAHTAAVDAGLAYLQQHGAYTRAGHGGIRVLDTDGLAVARFNEWTSRSGDMQLHTHCVILNRARTVEDGKWRALDGRAVLAARAGAGAIYARTVEAELTRRLRVAWRDRPDGLRELDGVDDDLIAAFSTRRRAITERVAAMAAAWEQRHGIPAPPAVLSSMAGDATLATRPAKRDLPPDVAVARWEDTARRHGRELRRLPARVVGRRPDRSPAAGDDADRVLEALAASGRATFSRHELLRAVLDTLPPGDDPPVLHARAQTIAEQLLSSSEVDRVTADDPIGVLGDQHIRHDGTSVYDPPHRHRWALQRTLDHERWLLTIGLEKTGHTAPSQAVNRAASRHGLGVDQADAIGQLLGTDRRIGLLVGPAGAGKTRTLRAVADVWKRTTSGSVVGLTVSQSAADVLAAETGIRTENTAKWLWETTAGRWQLPERPLVIIDEASMLSTDQLVALTEQTRRAGGRLLLVGDPAQLAAVHVGGAFDLLAERHGAARLTEVRRFVHAWERDASVLLRGRQLEGLARYATHGRIHGGPAADVETAMFDAWRADALDRTGGVERSVMMVVATNDQAAVLSERARAVRLAVGSVVDGPTVTLRDNSASVGDHIVTRRNDRRLRTDGRGWVVNGDVWTITSVDRRRGVTARRHGDDAVIWIPASYLREHAHLAYATTAHRAQGMTVDICHTAVNYDTSHELLYVGATRGRHANHIWVDTDADPTAIRRDDNLPDPEAVLARILQRRNPDRLAALQVQADSIAEMVDARRLASIRVDADDRSVDAWLLQWTATHGLDHIHDARELPTLTRRLATIAPHPGERADALSTALAMRPLDDARSAVAVLDWRIRQLHDPKRPTASPPTRVSRDEEHGSAARAPGHRRRQSR